MSTLGDRIAGAMTRHLGVHGDTATFKSTGLDDVLTTVIAHQSEWDIDGHQNRVKRLQRVIELRATDVSSPRQGDIIQLGENDSWVVEFVMGSRDGWHVLMTKRDEAMSTAGRRLPPKG